jgi:hypothetical protein
LLLGRCALPLSSIALLCFQRLLASQVPFREECPELFAAAERLPFAVADPLDQPGDFRPAVKATPVNPDDVAVQGTVFPDRRRLNSKIPACGLRIAYGLKGR